MAELRRTNPAPLRFLRFVFDLGQSFVLGGALVALWTMPFWTWNGSVQLHGLKHLDDHALADTLKGRRGLPLYQIDPRSVSTDLLKDPGVQDVKVRRWLFPARLEVTIREREPVARILNHPKFRYVDDQGVLFDLPAEFPQLPMTLTAATSGGRLSEHVIPGYKDLLEHWPAKATGSVDMTSSLNWTATIGNVPVQLGEPKHLSQKLIAYKHLSPLAHRDGQGIEYMDLRHPDIPVVKGSDSKR